MSLHENPSELVSSATGQTIQEVCLVVVIAASIVLNFSVLFVIFRNKQLRKRTTNIFILNLVFSNALMAIFVMPLSLAALERLGWNLDDTLCKVNGMSSTMLCLASISTLCCISADRYFAVVRPMRYKHVLTPKRAVYMLALVWFGSLSLACLPLFAGYRYHPGTNNCSPDWNQSCGLYAFMTIAAFGVPVVILLFTYGMIFSSIRRHAKRVSHWRVSKDSSRGKTGSGSRNTDVTGNGLDSFLSQSVAEEEQSNFQQVKATAYVANEIPVVNSTSTISVFQREERVDTDVVVERRNVKMLRSHSDGFNRISDGNILPFLMQLKTEQIKNDDDKNEERHVQRPRSCVVRTQCSLGGVIPGTLLPFCSLDQLDQENSPAAKSRSLRLSFCDLTTTGENVSKEYIPSRLDLPPINQTLHRKNDLSEQKLRAHSIDFKVSGVESSLKPILNNPATFSVKVLEDACTQEKLPRLRAASLSPSSSAPIGKSHLLQLPSISNATHAQLAGPISPGSPALQRPKSRSRSLSFGALPEKHPPQVDSTTLTPPHPPQQVFQMSSSPLLRLRAITQLKRKLRVSSIPREYKIAKTGFILVLVFFLSWGPYLLVNNCQHTPETPMWVYRTAIWLVYISCILNPIVYALSSRHIRTAFNSHLKCCRRIPPRAKWRLTGIDNR